MTDIEEPNGETSKRWWRSLDELAGTPGFEEQLHREFPRAASEWDEGVSRRRFLELMSASAALGGLAACTRQPREFIVPYVKQPEEVVPGRPLFFASVATLGGYGAGVIVESHEGRPTKVEGNPDHPASLGATDVFTQASVLGLYDPDRAQTVTRLGRIATWPDFLSELEAKLRPLRALGGDGLRILTETVTSPTLAAQMKALLLALPKARWHQWEPAGRDAARSGAALAFGQPAEVRYDFSKADVLVALDADPFNEGPGKLRYVRDFARRRRAATKDPGAAMPRYFAVESLPTVSGSLADHRLRLRSADIPPFTLALAAAVGVPGAVQPPLDPARAKWLDAAARELAAARGRSLVMPGEFTSPAVHAVCAAINQVLGNLGSTVLVTEPVEAEPVDQLSSLRALVADMFAGKVDVLMILGSNPVFTAPADFDVAGAMGRVALRVHVSLYPDETSAYCHWLIPEAHPLETWGDARVFDGMASIQQPLIEPLWDGKAPVELLDVVLAPDQPPRRSLDIVKGHWQSARGGTDFEMFWRRALHDGVVPGTRLPPKGIVPADDGIRAAIAGLAAAPPPGLEIVFRPDPGIHDGRFANNGWLQELPRPLSKLTWDNAVHVSPATASRLGVKSEDVVELSLGGRKVEAPVWVTPGHADDCLAVHFGHGRSRAGRVGSGTGFDAYRLRTSKALWSAGGVSLERTGRTFPLATTQTHFVMEGRNLARAGTITEYRKDPGFVKKMDEGESHDVSLYPGFGSREHAWGVSVNLSACTGCSACVVACQSENNIPVVGKDQVRRGREMHWIRIDRYYEGPAEDPQSLNQPVFCQQCEKAPCEVVCPVAATTHSDEGLNEMTYNRCVGTRYCSNNCPYKVRRFNFYERNADKMALPVLRLLSNPNVTVRSRGVMEKCTYCVQRINRARIDAEKENRPLRDGEILTACQQVCPTEAIVFGDINDPGSRVHRLKEEPLDYSLLQSLDTRPRTTYLARLTNPSPRLSPGAPAGREDA